jgi:hypothetical protein
MTLDFPAHCAKLKPTIAIVGQFERPDNTSQNTGAWDVA